jgi:hypothetical protein
MKTRFKNTSHNPISSNDKDQLRLLIGKSTILRLVVTDSKDHTQHVEILKSDAQALIYNNIQFQCYTEMTPEDGTKLQVNYITFSIL